MKPNVRLLPLRGLIITHKSRCQFSPHIRTDLATVSRFKAAVPARLKVATHSHFKIATLRKAGVRNEPDIGNTRNSMTTWPQNPLTGHRRWVVGGDKDFTIEWRLFKRSNEY